MRVVRKFDFKGAGGTRDHEHGAPSGTVQVEPVNSG